MIQIFYDRGTIVVKGEIDQPLLKSINYLVEDKKSDVLRCHAYHYRKLILAIDNKISYQDFVAQYKKKNLTWKKQPKTI